ncbi:hypothetical protein TomMM35A_31700 [Sphingobium sp. TomMM35A]
MTRSLRRSARIAAQSALMMILISTPTLAAAASGTPPRPKLGSAEYRLSWGVKASRATGVYRKGATGKGIVVAMIDTGIGPDAAGLFSDLSPHSIDLVPDRRFDTGDRRHGEQTASLLAARVDGAGTFGIAYEATLLSIRTDRDGSCLRTCAFDPPLLAKAIDYALDHGASVIGMPMASRRAIQAIEPALERAAKRGVVIVAAAGNDGADQPVWPARYATDPRFASSMLVSGAATLRGRMAPWSNKAGATRSRYVVAPGEYVVVDCGERSCSLVSGTSYSVAYTAGAIALLLSRAPHLSGPQAASMLLQSADDLAERGTDHLTGRGRLNVGRAIRAVQEAKG